MGKLLFWIVVVGLVWWLWLGRRKVGDGAAKPEAAPEAIVSCAHCGVYLPVSESVLDGNVYYCSEPHRAAGPAQGRE